MEAEGRAASLIDQHRPKLDRLIAMLEAKETLQRDDIEVCLEVEGPKQARSQ